MSDLTKVQSELKVPKNRWNKFGEFYYRNLEDIMDAVKPLLDKYNCTLIFSDDIVQVGADNYVVASAIFTDSTGTVTEVKASAREIKEKKKMDASQLTGTASSYARKYAANGLLQIDDIKDSDNQDNTKNWLTPDMKTTWENAMKSYLKEGNLDKVLSRYDMTDAHKQQLMDEATNAS